MLQVAVLSFGAFVYFNPDTPLTAEVIFISLMLMNAIRRPMNQVPYILTDALQVYSLKVPQLVALNIMYHNYSLARFITAFDL